MFVDVALPLYLENLYTYFIPREFEDFTKVRENELNYVKNTGLVEKKVLSAEEMYGRPKIVENISSI